MEAVSKPPSHDRLWIILSLVCAFGAGLLTVYLVAAGIPPTAWALAIILSLGMRFSLKRHYHDKKAFVRAVELSSLIEEVRYLRATIDRRDPHDRLP